MNPLKVGELAPDFTLSDQTGQRVHLSDYKGKTVVLYFYPKDDTPGCTKEACDFRDYEKDFTRLETVILGVSKDNEASHQKFIEKYGLPFRLLADPETKVLQAYGVWQPLVGQGTGMHTVRTTYVIDPVGKISKLYDKVKVENHVAAVLDELKKEKRF